MRGEAPSMVERIEKSPESWYGKQVTLKGEIDELLGDRTFELEVEKGQLWDDDIVVLMRSDQPLAEDAEVEVRGTVTKFSAMQIERDLGLDLAADFEREHEGNPVIVAESVTVTREPAAAKTVKEGTITSLTAIRDADPDSVVGREVSIENIPVRTVAGMNAFFVGSGDEPPMLIATGEGEREPQAQVSERQRVNIRGTLQKMPQSSVAKQRWNLTNDDMITVEQQQLYIRAERIEPSGGPS